MLDDQVREALRFLDDPIALEDSPLARLAIVGVLTITKFRGRTCATGLALRNVLREMMRSPRIWRARRLVRSLPVFARD